MKAIKTQLNEQKKGQFKEDAIKSIEIYDALITIYGKIWDKSWQTLVICQWRATDYYYKPSNHIVENNEMVYATYEQIPANFAKTCKDEQKHADKVEPKFQVGDWVIVRNKDAYQVIEVNAHDYRLKHVLGGEMPFPFTQESSLKSWTIEDAFGI